MIGQPHILRQSHGIDYDIVDLQERVNRLEVKLFKKKPPTTLNQQVLLLHHLGMLDKLHQLPIAAEKKKKLLSIILNGDFSNTKKAFEALSKEESNLRIPFNYEFLKETFETLDLMDEASKMNTILQEIQADKK
jgi:hypothetical protein